MSFPHHRELQRLLRRGTPVYLPVNPTEFHGPHLSLFNDHLISVGVARDMHRRLCARMGDMPLLLAEDVGVGVQPCPGPGSRATSYRTVRRMVRDAVNRLADLGATRVVLITFHGDPLHNHALQAGVKALQRRGVAALAPLNLALDQLAAGALEGVEAAWSSVRDESDRAALEADVASDFHAGFVETSLSLHHAARTVGELRDLPPCPPIVPDRVAKTVAAWARAAGLERLGLELDVVARGLGWYAMRPFLGYTGRPDLANPEAGAVFAEALADGFAEAAYAVFEQGAAAPTPPMTWLPAATLGGRVGGVHVPPSAFAHGGA